MKYIKSYEAIDDLEVGDYVICKNLEDKPISGDYIKTYEFIENSVGRYIKYDRFSVSYPYIIKFENIPEDIKHNFRHSNLTDCRRLNRSEIIDSSLSKAELQAKLESKKYNL
jgi:hypothetical protein